MNWTLWYTERVCKFASHVLVYTYNSLYSGSQINGDLESVYIMPLI